MGSKQIIDRLKELYYSGVNNNRICEILSIRNETLNQYINAIIREDNSKEKALEFRLKQIKDIESLLFSKIEQYRNNKSNELNKEIKELTHTYSTFNALN